MSDINIIRLHNASFYAYHGVADGEQELGGKYEVDFEAYIDFEEAARLDDLNKTIDYEQVYNLIKRIICQRKYYLIETVTYEIANEIFNNFKQPAKIIVRVRKYNPPVKGVVEFVETEVIKERNNK